MYTNGRAHGYQMNLFPFLTIKYSPYIMIYSFLCERGTKVLLDLRTTSTTGSLLRNRSSRNIPLHELLEGEDGPFETPKLSGVFLTDFFLFLVMDCGPVYIYFNIVI